jgi:GTP-binding protein
MRKKGKIDENIERYSVIRALSAVDRANVVIIMIDANENVTEQDTKIAGYAHESGKGCIIAVNKWDLIEKETKTMDNYRRSVQEGLAYMTYAPLCLYPPKRACAWASFMI